MADFNIAEYYQSNVRPDSMERITTPELAKEFIDEQVELIRKQVGDGKVLLALSGGVDSSVVAALLIKAIGKQLTCIHVNHGLMRKGESQQVIDVFQKQLGANLIYIDATDRFLDLLAGVEEPEQKRKIIGGEFIKVFDEEASKLTGIGFLGQGTIYPDILESKDGIKAHHNVGGLPEDVELESCVKSSPRQASTRQSGSTSQSYRPSKRPASRTERELLNGPASSAPSIPKTRSPRPSSM